MKTKLLFLLAIVFATITNAQVTDYVAGLSSPSRLIIDGNMVYTKEIDKISQIDVTNNTPATTLFNNLPINSEFNSVVKNGDVMMISYYNYNTSSSNLASFDINTPGTRTDWVTGLGWTPAIALHGNDLYFVEEVVANTVALKKIDTSQPTPTVTTIIANTGMMSPQDMAFNGDMLYISDKDTDIIYAVDVTTGSPILNSFITGANARGLYVHNDLLLYSDAGVLKKAPFANPSNSTTIATASEFLRDAVVYGNTVYMPQETAGKIVSIIDPTLGVSADVINPLTGAPTGFALAGNDLYYAISGTISKIDVTAATSFSPTVIVSGLNEPEGIVLNGNDLYIAQAGANKVSKIDITNPTPTVTDVATGLNEPTYLALNGNDLYISEIGGGKVSKLDITVPTPTTTTDVVTGLTTPLDLEINGNDLYIVEVNANKISNATITAPLPTTATDVVTGLNKPLQLTLDGNDLYFSQTNGNKISKIDVTNPTPTVVDVLTDINSAESLASNGSDLYYSTGDRKIAKVSLATLSINDNVLVDKISIYPNPVKNKLNITVDNAVIISSVKVYNIMGQAVKTFNNTSILNINSLSNGVYFVKVNTNKGSVTKKIVKE